MRIGILTYTRAWGGGERHAELLQRCLANRGHEVTIYCLDEGTQQIYSVLASRGIAVDCLGLTRPPNQLSYGEWRRALRKFRADACVYEFNWYTEGSLAMDLMIRARVRRYVRVEHFVALPMPERESRRHLFGLVPGLGLWWHRWRLQNYLRSIGPHSIVGVSDAACRRLLADHGYPARKVAVVHNGVDTVRFRPSLEDRAEIRERFCIPRDAVVIGCVARLTWQKGIDRLLEVVAQRLPDLSAVADVVVLLGGDGDQRVELERQAERLGLRDRVRFTGFCAEPWKIHAALDVFVMPSRWESLPYSLLEAMAVGCQVVAYDVAGVGEVISRPDLGWLVPEGSEGALGDAILAAVSRSPQERQAQTERSRQHIREYFDQDRQLARLARIVEGTDAK